VRFQRQLRTLTRQVNRMRAICYKYRQNGQKKRE
jgi:hypothetical protein